MELYQGRFAMVFFLAASICEARTGLSFTEQVGGVLDFVKCGITGV